MVLVPVKYGKKLAKLSKLRNLDSFKALVEKLLEATAEDPETMSVVLKTASVNAARLKLWSDCLSLSTHFFKNASNKDPLVVQALSQAVVNIDNPEYFDQTESLVNSYLRAMGVHGASDDVDVSEYLTARSIPSLNSNKKPRGRRHKPLFPKSFNPDKPGPLPDPERWLPKNQRTRQVKKTKKGGTGFQGGAPVGDVTKTVSTAQSEISKDRRRRKK